VGTSTTGNIAKVVAMIAAVRMARGNWGSVSLAAHLDVHWDWIPDWLSYYEISACGTQPVSNAYKLAAGIEDVTCCDCKRMYARVYGSGGPS